LEHYARGNTWKKWCVSRRIPQEGHPWGQDKYPTLIHCNIGRLGLMTQEKYEANERAEWMSLDLLGVLNYRRGKFH
jgi:hypothetical protein